MQKLIDFSIRVCSSREGCNEISGFSSCGDAEEVGRDGIVGEAGCGSAFVGIVFGLSKRGSRFFGMGMTLSLPRSLMFSSGSSLTVREPVTEDPEWRGVRSETFLTPS